MTETLRSFVESLIVLLVGLNASLAQLPQETVTTASHLRLVGPSPALELLDEQSVQNWYVGINDGDADSFEIGRGYGSSQGLPPSLTINKTTLGVTVGAKASQTMGAIWNVVSSQQYGQNDWVGWTRRIGGVSNHWRMQHYSESMNPEVVLTGIVARGTLESPQAVRNGDNLMIVDGRGYDGSTRDYTEYAVGWSDGQGTSRFFATEDWREGAHGTGWLIQTTPNGSVRQYDRFGVEHDGTLNLAGVPVDEQRRIRVRLPDGSVGWIRVEQ